MRSNWKKGIGCLVCLLMLALALPALALATENALPEGSVSAAALPEAKGAATAKGTTKLQLKIKSKTMTIGDESLITARVWYRGSWDVVYVSSDDESIVSLKMIGEYMYACANNAGKVTLRGRSGAKTAKLTITVKYPKATSVTLDRTSLSLKRGEAYALEAHVLPERADQDLYFSTSNKKVAVVDAQGYVTGLKPGTATITVKSGDKRKKATCKVTVYEPVKRRGIAITECSGTKGSDTSSSARTGENLCGTANLRGVEKLFKKYGITTRTVKNASSWTSVASDIRAAFAGADADDVSYLYINAHGGVYNNQLYIAIASGNSDYLVSASQLRALLDTIPGYKVIFLESCHSGSAVAKDGGSTNAKFGQAFVNAFKGGTVPGASVSKNGELAATPYLVMCSAEEEGVSYFFWNTRMLGKKKFTAALFTYAFARGAGWDIVSNKSVSREADHDKNKVLTLVELMYYTDETLFNAIDDIYDRYGEELYQEIFFYPDDDSAMGNTFPIFVG